MKDNLLKEIDKVCEDLQSERDRLELLKYLRSNIDSRIKDLTSSESGQLYNNSFRADIMGLVSRVFPNLDSYSSYDKYQEVRKEIVGKLGVSSNTRMLTDEEYKRCVELLKEYESERWYFSWVCIQSI